MTGSKRAPKIPERLAWAVDLLGPWPGASVLEIGCGRGVAARLLCEKLGPEGYLGLDRSKIAIDAARKLNAEAIGRGVAEFVLGELSEVDFGRRRFDRILAININAFWTGGDAELATLMSVLKERGRVLLAYEAPSPSAAEAILEKLRPNLRSGGLAKLNSMSAVIGGKRQIATWASR